MTENNDRVLTIAEAIREGITEEMQRDSSVFCIGEDIGITGGWGGAFTVTLGLEKLFPDRIINTPISEIALFGSALGAAVMGMKPIADVQYGDFLFCAMDQIVSQISIMRYMSGGKIKVPIVMRAPVGASNRGAQHAHSMESWFINIPGIKVICPSNAYDAKGMLKSAVRDGNPVMIFEHKLLYGSKGARAEKGTIDASRYIPVEDYTVPIGKAEILKEGTDVTILSTLLMLHRSLNVAGQLEEKGISCEVIDLRSLVPLDTECIFNSVKKTGKVVIVEECTKRGGWGAEIAATIAESIPEHLLAPIKRIAALDTPVPFAPIMENYYVPSVEKIMEGVTETVQY
ncbi:MAG: alpha-ketoacid dehydrogenase subunit beta [Clostridiales bacterium]|nr:alpha-ketoacid dehydrogenase subunit beta [Clostridiales bacterium]